MTECALPAMLRISNAQVPGVGAAAFLNVPEPLEARQPEAQVSSAKPAGRFVGKFGTAFALKTPSVVCVVRFFAVRLATGVMRLACSQSQRLTHPAAPPSLWTGAVPVALVLERARTPPGGAAAAGRRHPALHAALPGWAFTRRQVSDAAAAQFSWELPCSTWEPDLIL